MASRRFRRASSRVAPIIIPREPRLCERRNSRTNCSGVEESTMSTSVSTLPVGNLAICDSEGRLELRRTAAIIVSVGRPGGRLSAYEPHDTILEWRGYAQAGAMCACLNSPEWAMAARTTAAFTDRGQVTGQ